MNISCDFLVIGSGIAGLCFAIHASRYGTVMMITKKTRSESSTNRAQGGIACVLAPHDSFAQHHNDTLIAGRGLCNEEAVRLMVENGPARVRELVEWGVGFSSGAPDDNGFGLHLGKEGGHSTNRIVHAHDLTGREVENALLHRIRTLDSIRLLENHVAVELITSHFVHRHRGPNRCYGAYVFDSQTRTVFPVRAKVTCIATGGAGQAYLHTTNPSIATGDGIAMAYRAGVTVANMEFIQFHPTSLYHPGADSFLISEALRGYGAVLRNAAGVAFMDAYHPQGSLAPRDDVARAIDREMKKAGTPCVYLDIRHAPASRTRRRFPNIYARCKELGIDITADVVPVVPAAHYVCGGIRVDLEGNTSLPGLYACGESACTGVHGANRLASNSLLEALVYAKRAAENARTRLGKTTVANARAVPAWDDSGTSDTEEWILLAHNFDEIRTVMWDYVGIVRSTLRLQRARRRLRLLEREIEDYYKRTRITPELLDLRNIVTTATLIVQSALRRHESRGLHYTTDYPHTDDHHWRRDTVLSKRMTS